MDKSHGEHTKKTAGDHDSRGSQKILFDYIHFKDSFWTVRDNYFPHILPPLPASKTKELYDKV